MLSDMVESWKFVWFMFLSLIDKKKIATVKTLSNYDLSVLPSTFPSMWTEKYCFWHTHTHALWSSLMAYINSNLYDVLLQLFFIFHENKWHIFVILLTKFLINFILVVSFVKAYLWICLLINSTH